MRTLDVSNTIIEGQIYLQIDEYLLNLFCHRIDVSKVVTKKRTFYSVFMYDKTGFMGSMIVDKLNIDDDVPDEAFTFTENIEE